MLKLFLLWDIELINQIVTLTSLRRSLGCFLSIKQVTITGNEANYYEFTLCAATAANK